MRYWLYPQYYGGGKGPTLRGALRKWICEWWHVHSWRGFAGDHNGTWIRCDKCDRIWFVDKP
jgi:hypothetical protein